MPSVSVTKSSLFSLFTGGNPIHRSLITVNGEVMHEAAAMGSVPHSWGCQTWKKSWILTLTRSKGQFKIYTVAVLISHLAQESNLPPRWEAEQRNCCTTNRVQRLPCQQPQLRPMTGPHIPPIMDCGWQPFNLTPIGGVVVMLPLISPRRHGFNSWARRPRRISLH